MGTFEKVSRSDLPEGVPPSNEKQSFSAPPDVATPEFLADKKSSSISMKQTREIYVRIDEEDDDEETDDGDERTPGEEFRDVIVHQHPPPAVMPILLAVAALLMALGFLVVMNNRQPQPLCSQQPEWNQYNCKPG